MNLCRPLSAVFLSAAVLIATSNAFATDLLPAIAPNPTLLEQNDLVQVPTSKNILLRFSNGIMNTGAGELHVVAYRVSASPFSVDLNNDTIPAYQRILRDDGTFYDVPVGQLLYHPEHHHFHFDGAARYRLIDPDSNAVVKESPKVSFCLADVDIVDSSLPGFKKAPKYNSCIHDPYATFGEMGISVGWEDIYDKSLIGQAFDVTDLMQLPAKDYILESTTNPQSLLHELNASPVSARVRVRVGIGVPVKVGNSRPGV